MERVYPRVLVVNAVPFNKKSAIGITMTNLFRGWPKDRLAQVHAGGVSVDNEVCQKFWCLEAKFFGITQSIKKIQRLMLKDNIRPNFDSKKTDMQNTASTISEKSLFHSLLYELFNPYLWMELIPYRLTPQFWNWIREFRPQLIYCEPYFINIGYIILAISSRFGIPIVPHFTDDWINSRFLYPRHLFIQRYFLLRNLRRILSLSSMRLVISRPMADEYRYRFGGEFTPFANCVEVEKEFPLKKENPGLQRKKKLVYIGGLHFLRWQPLLDIAKAIADLNTKEQNTAEMLIFAPEEDARRYGAMFDFTHSVRFAGTLPAGDVPGALRQADVVIHVESFDRTFRRLTRLSMSTKISQYMAAGRPILAYGPQDGGSCRYIQECGCGVVVGRKDENALRSAVSLLISDDKLRERLGRAGWAVAQERHSAEKVREEFRGILVGAIKGN